MLLDVNEKPAPPPEALLLDAARKRKGLSHRALGDLVDLSDGRVRQVLNGYQTPGGGEYFPVSGKPEVIGRMALVLDVPRKDLVAAGRGDAAEVLDHLTRSTPTEGRPSTLAGFTNDELLAEVRARMKGERDGRQPEPEKSGRVIELPARGDGQQTWAANETGEPPETDAE